MWRVVLIGVWMVCGVLARAGAQPVCGDVGAVGESEPVSVMVFSDFQCAYCEQVGPLLERLKAVYPGPVDVLFKHAPRTQEADLWLVHEAALAAGAQGRFWAFHDSIFAATQPVGRAELEAFAGRLGLDMAVFSRALDTHQYRGQIERDLAEARALWVTGTPAFYVNGVDLVGVGAFAEFVEALTGAQGEPGKMVQVEVEQAPAVGPVEAPVTLVSFIDLRCGYCADGWPNVARVVAAFDGQVRWVFKHFPLAFHTDAPTAHVGALAAGEQGKFWEMATQILTHSDPVQRVDLVGFARSLGLDVGRFEADLDRQDLLDRVQKDVAEGRQLGVRGTPTFYIDGKTLAGAQPAAVLQAAINEALMAQGHPVHKKEDNLWLDLEAGQNRAVAADTSGVPLR